MPKQLPEPGDIVQVNWLDIQEDVTGNSAKAHVARRVSVGIFLGWEMDEEDRILVTTTTKDKGAADQSGWCAYPEGVIKSITVIKKGKRGGRRNTKTSAKRRADSDHGHSAVVAGGAISKTPDLVSKPAGANDRNSEGSD